IEHTVRSHRARNDLPNGVIEVLLGPRITGRALGEDRLNSLEKRDVVANRERLGVRNSEGERLGQLAHRPYTAILTILLLENVLLRRGKQPQSLLRRTGAPPRPIQPVEETTA